MQQIFSPVIWSLGIALILMGCNQPAAGPQHVEFEQSTAVYQGDGPIRILVTSGMVADIAREVGGEHVEVDPLMGPGVDPHLYNPTPKDVARLAEADVIFFSGLHLEAGLENVLASQSKKKPVLPVTRKAETDTTLSGKLFDMDGGFHDPHVWFDPDIWTAAVQTAGEELARFDPPHADDYKAAANDYAQRILAVFKSGRERLTAIPKPQRLLITAHDAFTYFGRAFDVEVMAIQGVSTDAEAGVRRINELVDVISTRKINAVFTESTLSDDNMKSLVEGCRARGHEVRLGGELFSDALGPVASEAESFLGMLQHNIETIAEALSGAPESAAATN